MRNRVNKYTENLDEVLADIKQHQIITISNSVDLDSYALNLEIAKRSKLIIPVFGIHPVNASKYASNLNVIDEALESSPFVGRIGLDFSSMKSEVDMQDQLIVFEYLLKFASNNNRYVIVNSKESDEEMLGLFEKYKIKKAIIDDFTGSQEVFEKMLNNGFFFTVGTSVLRSNEARHLARKIPEDQLLVATGNSGVSADQLPVMPAIINDIVKELALQRNTSERDIIRIIERNFLSILQSNRSLAKFSKKIARDFKNRRGARTL